MFRDAQTRTMEIANIREEYSAGWISQNEAATKAVGHDADVPEPRYDANGSLPQSPLVTDQDPAEARVLSFQARAN
jgi:hypothetical protein